jgi:hypothetical protein
MLNGNATLVHGGLTPDTGELSWYAIGILRQNRPENPSITIDAARSIAESDIQRRNGILPINLSEARYDPLGMPGMLIAGRDVFVYKRLIKGVSCDSDGILVVVDPVSGKVVEYSKQWSLNESMVTPSAKPDISQEAAIQAVLQKAAEIYPDSAVGLRIISADLRWMDYHNPDKVTPATGSIPLAWRVQFDDETLRAKQWPSPVTGWVDAQTGILQDMHYYH